MPQFHSMDLEIYNVCSFKWSFAFLIFQILEIQNISVDLATKFQLTFWRSISRFGLTSSDSDDDMIDWNLIYSKRIQKPFFDLASEIPMKSTFLSKVSNQQSMYNNRALCSKLKNSAPYVNIFSFASNAINIMKQIQKSVIFFYPQRTWQDFQ